MCQHIGVGPVWLVWFWPEPFFTPKVLPSMMFDLIQQFELILWMIVTSDYFRDSNSSSVLVQFDKQPENLCITTKIPEYLWQWVGTNLFHFKGGLYLVVVKILLKVPKNTEVSWHQLM